MICFLVFPYNKKTTMSDAITITTNGGFFARRFERYLKRSIQISKRSVQTVVTEQAKGLVREAFKHTPPMAGRSFFQGKKASQNAIATTLARATKIENENKLLARLNARSSKIPKDVLQKMLADVRTPAGVMAKRIRSHRKPDKTYPDSGPKFFVTKQTRKQLQQLFELTMGATAAGWCAAADKLGVRYPDWIGRWSASNNGTFALFISDNKVLFHAKNPNRHKDSATIQRALDSAFDAQADRMRNRLINAIAKGILKREDVFMR